MTKSRGTSRPRGPARRAGASKSSASAKIHGGSGPRLAPDGPEAYVLRCAPGLARVLQAELRFDKLLRHGDRADVLWQRNHDLLFLPRLQREPGAGDLRVAEELHRCLIYGRYKVSDSQLDRLAQRVRGQGKAWRIVVTADGEHFNRFDLGRWLGRELARRGLGIDESAPRTLFVFCVEQAYYVCTPLRPAERASGRGQREVEREGSLPPTIAAAMAFLGKPAAEDVILDPVCGSGTLLAEAHAYAPAAALHGIDSDATAVKAARRNLAGAAAARIEQGDGRACGLPDASVSLVLANLPFGKQFGDPGENRTLYRELLAELRRLAAPHGWRAVLLASDAELLAEAVTAQGFEVRRRLPLRVRGEPATMLLVESAA